VDANPIAKCGRVGHHIESIRAAPECLKYRRDVFGSPNFGRRYLKPKCAGGCLNLAKLMQSDGIADIGDDRQMAQPRHSLAQKLDPLAGNVGLLEREARNITSWSRQGIYIARAYRVSCYWEHNRNH
jgi:hypothetical protein